MTWVLPRAHGSFTAVAIIKSPSDRAVATLGASTMPSLRGVTVYVTDKEGNNLPEWGVQHLRRHANGSLKSEKVSAYIQSTVCVNLSYAPLQKFISNFLEMGRCSRDQPPSTVIWRQYSNNFRVTDDLNQDRRSIPGDRPAKDPIHQCGLYWIRA